MFSLVVLPTLLSGLAEIFRAVFYLILFSLVFQFACNQVKDCAFRIIEKLYDAKYDLFEAQSAFGPSEAEKPPLHIL